MSIFFAGILFVFYLYLAIYLPWWKRVHESWSVYCPVKFEEIRCLWNVMFAMTLFMVLFVVT